jgi:hypothetical protein
MAKFLKVIDHGNHEKRQSIVLAASQQTDAGAGEEKVVGHASEATHYQPTQRKGGIAWWIGHRGVFFSWPETKTETGETRTFECILEFHRI